MKRYMFILIILVLSFVSRVSAKDLSKYFTVENVKICGDDNCEIVYDEENGVNAGKKFLVKINWSLHSPVAIEEGDVVNIPFASEVNTENTSAFGNVGFSWTDIYDENNKKIGQWRINGYMDSVKLSIKFSDNSVGKNDASGTFTTLKNIATSYTFVDKIIPLTVGNEKYRFKVNSISLTAIPKSSIFYLSSTSNSEVIVSAVSPRITIKELYNVDNNQSFSNEAIIKNMYFETTLSADLNATINRVTIYTPIYLPMSATNHNASYYTSNNLTATSLFTLVEQNANESYSEFKKRLKKYEYGIYTYDNDDKVIVINYGEQPSNYTYNDIINLYYPEENLESGDYAHITKPFTVNSQIRDVINNATGLSNRIGGKVCNWLVGISLNFPTVKVPTTKRLTGVWSWEDSIGQVKSEQSNIEATLVVPSSIASVSGTSQILLRDKDTKNEIIGATIKLQKKNGDIYEDVEELVTDETGMAMFRNLESGTYRYIQTSYLPHYKDDSFKTYIDENLSNNVVEFEFDKNDGNIIYATNERENFTVTYKKGTHGNFDDEVYNDIPYGETTPYFEPVGDENWIFKGWNPEREIFVTDNATYTATWSKLVNVTARYLELGTNNPLLDDIVDTKENGKEYETEQKEIENYDFVRVDGKPTGTREEEDIVVTYYYKKKESNLNIKYLDCSTSREIANSTNVTLYYGDNYDADLYETNITIPDNYNRSSASKSNNYKGVVDSDNINVEYCYNKKDSKLNTSITMTGSNNITKSTDKVSYQINYSTVFTDYIGEATIKIVDKLPYKIDVNDSNLDGGVYDEANKTITWQVNTNINSYENSEYNVTKNIELKYKKINLVEDVMVNNVSGKTEIDSKNKEVTTLYNTYIDVKGKIVVKYLEASTNNELEDSITTTDKVGKKYEFVDKDIEGYRLVKRPEKEKEEYKEEEQEFKFIYERIKYKITVTSNEGGSVTGDEEVYYNEDSILDNIKIKANDNYYIKEVSINGKKIDIPENSKELTIPQFKKMKEDKKIEVVFDKTGEMVAVPNTLKKSMLIIFGVITVLVSIGIILYILKKKN